MSASMPNPATTVAPPSTPGSSAATGERKTMSNRTTSTGIAISSASLVARSAASSSPRPIAAWPVMWAWTGGAVVRSTIPSSCAAVGNASWAVRRALRSRTA
jgi:hypothetical protein